MRKTIILAMVVVTLVTLILYRNDGGSGQVADQLEIESMKGDIVELTGKGMYYKNKHGSYPIYPDDVYEMDDSEVVRSLLVFENFFDKSYIQENLKLTDLGELKNKGITYELASKKTRYFFDVSTGNVLAADLMEVDDEYAGDVANTDELKVLETIKIVDSDDSSLVMTRVNGSMKSGSGVYFYGGGPLKLAKRDEMTNIIKAVDSGLGLAADDEILYIQPSTFKAVILKNGEVIITTLKLK